jgi:hypothetical protein
LKAKRKAQTSNKLKRTLSTQLETVSRDDFLEEKRSFNKFAVKVKPYLPGMEAEQRDALLTELHRRTNFKTILESYTTIQRKDTQENARRFRKSRLWLVGVEKKLNEAMKAMEEAAPPNICEISGCHESVPKNTNCSPLCSPNMELKARVRNGRRGQLRCS